jgi:hypothetical protein
MTQIPYGHGITTTEEIHPMTTLIYRSAAAAAARVPALEAVDSS